ncbi:type I methionyl aminopeptidase [Fibrobacterota bacterium]
MIHVKSEKEIELMRKSGSLAARILKEAVSFTRPGVTTNQINDLVHDLTVKQGAIPSPLNYRGFPKSVCTSVNEVVTHGIPSDYVLKDGDIVNIDVTCNVNGYHGDTSAMVAIGNISAQAKELIEVTMECLQRAIEVVKPGGYYHDIGEVIQDIADEHDFGVVSEYCGHGIGRNFHEDPLVLHHRSIKQGAKICQGHVFTIEPMINTGTPSTKVLNDGWTVVTKDGGLSAQYEHTLAVTARGVEILTPYSGD